MKTYNDVINNEDIKNYIIFADESLKALGYTEHSFAHVYRVAQVCKYVLETLDYPERDIELAQIAGYLHDIGNLINRVDHAQSGALMAFHILTEMGFDSKEVSKVITAIGNHDEETAYPVSAIAAALIIGDKTDVRRSRVRNTNELKFDIHDRVNYSVVKSDVNITEDRKTINLIIEIDTKECPVMDYFEIFLGRMILCRNAAEKLNLTFGLIINNQKLL